MCQDGGCVCVCTECGRVGVWAGSAVVCVSGLIVCESPLDIVFVLPAEA